VIRLAPILAAAMTAAGPRGEPPRAPAPDGGVPRPRDKDADVIENLELLEHLELLDNLELLEPRKGDRKGTGDASPPPEKASPR